MANIGKFRAHESLNVDTAAVWDVQTRIQIDAGGGLSAGVSGDLSSYNQVCIEAEVEVYFRFDTSTGNTIVANNDPTIPATTLTFMKIPKGVGRSEDSIYMHFYSVASTSGANKYVKLVLL